MRVLSLYDLTGIQAYIFSSNILKENLGASYLADLALGDWVRAAAGSADSALRRSGGGNALVESGDCDLALAIATRLSALMQREAPGLELVCAHTDWDGSDAGYPAARERLQAEVQSASDLYRAGRARLHARPYCVVGDPLPTQPFRRWPWFRETLLRALQEQVDSHTRFKDLAGVLQRGPAAAEVYLARLRDRFRLSRAEQPSNDGPLCLPEPAGFPMQSGFANRETPYLDAIELICSACPVMPAAGASPSTTPCCRWICVRQWPSIRPVGTAPGSWMRRP